MANILIIFGKRVRQLRKSKRMTQEKLAERAGLHTTFIGAVERGEKNPSLSSMAKISKALDVGIRDLFPPGKTSSESSQAVAEILDLLQGKKNKDIQLAKKVLGDVFTWMGRKT